MHMNAAPSLPPAMPKPSTASGGTSGPATGSSATGAPASGESASGPDQSSASSGSFSQALQQALPGTKAKASGTATSGSTPPLPAVGATAAPTPGEISSAKTPSQAASGPSLPATLPQLAAANPASAATESAQPSVPAGKATGSKGTGSADAKKSTLSKPGDKTSGQPQAGDNAQAAAAVPLAAVAVMPQTVPAGNDNASPSSGAQGMSVSNGASSLSHMASTGLSGGAVGADQKTPADQKALPKAASDSFQAGLQTVAQASTQAPAVLPESVLSSAASAVQAASQPAATTQAAPAAASSPLPQASALAATHQTAAALVAMGPGPDPGTQRLTISLTPLELGHVAIQIDRLPDGSAAVAVSASHASTLAALHSDRPALEQALTQAGIPTTHRSVEFRLETSSSSGSASPAGQGSLSQGGNGQNRQAPRGMQFALPVSDTEAVAPQMRRFGVNLTA